MSLSPAAANHLLLTLENLNNDIDSGDTVVPLSGAEIGIKVTDTYERQKLS